MNTDPKTFTTAELLLHATEFQWDGLTIAAIVEDPSSAKTVAPTIHAWNVIDTAAGNWLRTDGGWGSGPTYEEVVFDEDDDDDDGAEARDEVSVEAPPPSRYTFPTFEAAFAAASRYRDEQARRGL